MAFAGGQAMREAPVGTKTAADLEQVFDVPVTVVGRARPLRRCPSATS